MCDCNEKKCSIHEHDNDHKHNHRHDHDNAVYGEFIRTFTFSEGVELPIVQPGGNLIFPIQTARPKHVSYVDNNDRVGLLVPIGTYLVSVVLNPSNGASIDLLVNNVLPLTSTNYQYTKLVTTTEYLNVEYLVHAPLRYNNLISLKNSGETLFTLNDIPNTRIGNTSVITHIRVHRLND